MLAQTFPKYPNLAQVYEVKWWMGHYGSSTPKPQKCWCNNRMFHWLDRGTFHRDTLVPKKNKVVTVRKSVSKTGKVQYTGTAQLKQTQSIPQFLIMQ